MRAILKILKSLLGLLAFAALALGAYGVWYARMPIEIGKLPVDFEIPQRARFRGAVDQMERAGVHVGRYQFEALARVLGRVRDVKAGSYELSQAVTPLDFQGLSNV